MLRHQGVQGGHRDLHALLPPDPLETGIGLGDPLPPAVGQGGEGGVVPAPGHVGRAGRGSQRLGADGDPGVPAHEASEPASHPGLRLQRHHPGPQGGESGGTVSQMGSHVEDQVTGGDEGAVELPEGPLAPGAAVHDEGAEEPQRRNHAPPPPVPEDVSSPRGRTGGQILPMIPSRAMTAWCTAAPMWAAMRAASR